MIMLGKFIRLSEKGFGIIFVKTGKINIDRMGIILVTKDFILISGVFDYP